ncbi:hypothetical protein PanWU01x14_153290 [Parasponia andersonii]|uniref:RNase H type-1 domain-containing protein n=1 Tax=Parasponia andersonii TaxID=3476 RepID=A0A2P5CH08_PARAD|nr:hypothetical protein PanWU01x14_153290 [Parasponia andersonii]
MVSNERACVVHELESDCLMAVTTINSVVGLAHDDIIVGDIQSLISNCCVSSCYFVGQESNKVVRTLATLCFYDDFPLFSTDDLRDCIATLVAADLL